MIWTSAKFPIAIGAAFGANIDGTPVVCGGSQSTTDGILSHSLVIEKCYRFSNGGWKEFASMKEKRFHSDGVIYDNKFHIFGGKNLVTSLKTSEIISLDGGVSKGPDLPTAVTG